MANEFFGVTDTANLRQALIASMIQDQLKESSRLAPTIMDYSMLAVKGAKSVSIPRGLGLAVTAKSEDTATAGSHFTYLADELTLAQRYVRVNPDDMAIIQSSPDIELDLVGRMGVALADDLDSLIYAQLKLASATAPDHQVVYTDTANDDIEVKDITNAMLLLNKQKVNMDGRYMLICPTQFSYLMNIDTFVEAHRLGSVEAIRNGFVGRIMGFDVVLSNVAETDGATIFYHKSAVAMAIQSGVKFEEARDLDYLANVKVASYIVGAKVLDAGKRNVLVSKTN